jgi:hypothetical protein
LPIHLKLGSGCRFASCLFIIRESKIHDIAQKSILPTIMKKNKRTPGLIAIVIYKAFSAILLAVVSVALFLAVKNSQFLVAFSEEYALTGKREIIKFSLEKITSVNPRTLQFSAIATAI